MGLIKKLFALVGLGSIGLCTAFAIKMPNVYKDLFDIVDKDKAIIQSVPYYVNFGDFESESAYRGQYFDYAKQNWYLSWGNRGEENHNMLLGWESKEQPKYGSFTGFDSVMKNIEVPKNSYYSFLVMDFDFDTNHLMQFSFSAYESLVNSETSLYLILSHNLGNTWSISKTIRQDEMLKNSELKFIVNEDSVFSRTTRYGLVLISDKDSARIELNTFIVSKLGGVSA